MKRPKQRREQQEFWGQAFHARTAYRKFGRARGQDLGKTTDLATAPCQFHSGAVQVESKESSNQQLHSKIISYVSPLQAFKLKWIPSLRSSFKAFGHQAHILLQSGKPRTVQEQ